MRRVAQSGEEKTRDEGVSPAHHVGGDESRRAREQEGNQKFPDALPEPDSGKELFRREEGIIEGDARKRDEDGGKDDVDVEHGRKHIRLREGERRKVGADGKAESRIQHVAHDDGGRDRDEGGDEHLGRRRCP